MPPSLFISGDPKLKICSHTRQNARALLPYAISLSNLVMIPNSRVPKFQEICIEGIQEALRKTIMTICKASAWHLRLE